jgi:parallel beta-helix repeat protein
MRSSFHSLIAAIVVFLAYPVFADTFEVGPGLAYENIGDVPWEDMGAGDLVLIHWRAQPYKEKWIIGALGTEQDPFIVRGVPNASGDLPVIDGRDATTRSQLNFWNEDRGVIKFGDGNTPSTNPTWVIIENLDIRSGRAPYQFTGRDGLSTYTENCAAIYLAACSNITIRNCILRDSGNGLFSAHTASDITVEGCRIYDNGIEGSYYMHNNYTEAFGITFQYNYFGPLRTGCDGNNLKDRSAGTVIRYNWIEGGNRQLDLVDSDYASFYNDPLYSSTYVYGNILIEPDNAGNSQIVHYGGDSGDTVRYRKGTLYFYNNTVVSTRSGNTTLFRLSTNEESCDCRNNIVYVTDTGNRLAMLDGNGVLHLRNNWFKMDWRDSHSSLDGEVHDDGGLVTGTSPGFVAEGSQDFHLQSGSDCENAGTSQHANVLPDHNPVSQYVKHQAIEPRPADVTFDIGAYELGEPDLVAPKAPTGLTVQAP